jgi:cytochrome c peroxidase
MMNNQRLLKRYHCLALILLGVLLLFVGIACQSQPPDSSLYTRTDNIIPDSSSLLTATPPPNPDWTPAEIESLKSLWLGSLPPLPPDPTNAVADDPRAAALGHGLFFDARLSANNQVSCATCHIPELMFTDGVPIALGTRLHTRNTSTIIGTAYNPWLMWDGHKDSQWAQAIGAIEHPDEQGSTRLHVLHLVGGDESYRTAYQALFGPLPDLTYFDRFPDSGGPVDYPPYRAAWESMSQADRETTTQVFVNVGKAIAAYERLILPGPTRFDRYVQAVLSGNTEEMATSLTPDEVAGLRLFIGTVNCIGCHRGPQFTDNQFHNTGVPLPEGMPVDGGRASGLERVRADEFNCRSRFSDADEGDCKALNAAQTGEVGHLYAFKTPTLRYLVGTDPYAHAGQFDTLEAVLDHYNQAPDAPAGYSELLPLGLSEIELAQLSAFLRSLSAPLAVPPELLAPPEE